MHGGFDTGVPRLRASNGLILGRQKKAVDLLDEKKGHLRVTRKSSPSVGVFGQSAEARDPKIQTRGGFNASHRRREGVRVVGSLGIGQLVVWPGESCYRINANTLALHPRCRLPFSGVI
jgi:hypothetical protein